MDTDDRENKAAATFDVDDSTTNTTLITSVEKTFEGTVVPPWKQQLTIRAFVVSFVLSILFTFIVMKLNLTTGIIPSLNVSAGLLGFFFVKTWTKLLEKSGYLKQPFTRQENTVIQTCVVASSGIAFSGGAASYVLGMSDRIAKLGDGSVHDTKNPSLGWMIGFIFIVSFIGLLSVVPLRNIMIIDYKLIYPSGTATAHLINSFHTPEGAIIAKKKVKILGKFFSFSFLWGFFQWFFAGGDDCGFVNFPTFGLKAYDQKFYFDFSATYVGVGMICPYIVNISLLLGAIISYGIMWPLIAKQKGHWFDATLEDSSLHGLQGYKIFIAIAIILADGLYNFVKIFYRSMSGLYKQYKAKSSGSILPSNEHQTPEVSPESFDDQRRTQYFLKDSIPNWFAAASYIAIALAIFTIGGWAGASHGGIVAGLAACGVMMNIVSTASDLTQDFKTGYMTLASPRSMFVSQIVGTAMGCIISPCVFWIFYMAYPDLGLPKTTYPAPFASLYRNIALLGVEGVSSLPKHCLLLCIIFFVVAIVINGLKDVVWEKYSKFIPIPMAMAIPFYIGGYFAIDMCVGSLILFVWEYNNKAKADMFAPAVASGLICGDGIWSLPSAILALAGVNPPLCMKFESSKSS
uniref:Uncharacterized protein n=1 Tax=Chenopodium quinoa TaxID=63459 RepID=A0A803MDC3_CHEQI